MNTYIYIHMYSYIYICMCMAYVSCIVRLCVTSHGVGEGSVRQWGRASMGIEQASRAFLASVYISIERDI